MTGCYVALVRHGDYHQLAAVPSAFQPFPLSEEGREQAEPCARTLMNFSEQYQVPVTAELHSSSLLRAWQTTDIIRQQLVRLNPAAKFSLVESARLAERCVGSVANLTITQIEQTMRDDPRYTMPPQSWKADSHYQLPFPGAESLLQAGSRVSAYLWQLMDRQRDSYPKGFLQVVVGHGAAFRHAAYTLGVMEFEQIARLSMYHATPVFLQQQADLSWCHIAGAWKVREPVGEDLD